MWLISPWKRPMMRIEDPSTPCRQCFGKGYQTETQYNYDGEAHHIHEQCRWCGGSGNKSIITIQVNHDRKSGN